MLVNSVLLSIHIYWSQVFIIPKKVLREVESICRAFLWTGDYYSGMPGYVVWANVRIPKYAGGLGIKKLDVWNVAAMGRYIWAISSKKDNMWIKWISEIYIRD